MICHRCGGQLAAEGTLLVCNYCNPDKEAIVFKILAERDRLLKEVETLKAQLVRDENHLPCQAEIADLREEAFDLKSERDRYKALSENQSCGNHPGMTCKESHLDDKIQIQELKALYEAAREILFLEMQWIGQDGRYEWIDAEIKKRLGESK